MCDCDREFVFDNSKTFKKHFKMRFVHGEYYVRKLRNWINNKCLKKVQIGRSRKRSRPINNIKNLRVKDKEQKRHEVYRPKKHNRGPTVDQLVSNTFEMNSQSANQLSIGCTRL